MLFYIYSEGRTKTERRLSRSNPARSRQSKVESGEIDARVFASTSVRESSKRSHRNQEEEMEHSANGSSANRKLFSKKVGDPTSFPVPIDSL